MEIHVYISHIRDLLNQSSLLKAKQADGEPQKLVYSKLSQADRPCCFVGGPPPHRRRETRGGVGRVGGGVRRLSGPAGGVGPPPG